MNQTFSLSRFMQLNRWFWAANGRTYSLGLLALLSITVFLLARVLTFNGYDAIAASNNVIVFMLLSLTAIGLLSCHIVSVLHDQSSAILYLMLPASRTEKFSVAVLYFVLLIIGYSLFFGIAETLIFQVANSRLPSTGNLYRAYVLDRPLNQGSNIATAGCAFLLMAAICLLSSLYFRQGVVVKVTVLIICLVPGLTILYSYLIGAFFPGLDTQTINLFGDLYIAPSQGNYASAPRLSAPDFVKYVFPWLVLGALWITARIRFNEIER